MDDYRFILSWSVVAFLMGFIIIHVAPEIVSDNQNTMRTYTSSQL
jgi:hypothetical protein